MVAGGLGTDGLALRLRLAVTRRCGMLSLVFAILAVGCGSKPAGNTPSVHKIAAADPWLLTCLDPAVQTPALLWNGQLGIRIGRDGTGSGPMFSIDEYDTTGEEKIQPLPNVLKGAWYAGDDRLALGPQEATDYRQVIHMQTGVLTTSWSQTVGGVRLEVSGETVISPGFRLLAQRWTIKAPHYVQLIYAAAVSNATREQVSDPAYHLQWQLAPSGVPVREIDRLSPEARHIDPADKYIPAWNASGNELGVVGAADAGRPFTLERFLMIGGVEGSRIPSDFDSVRRTSERAWHDRWQTDIEIDGPVEDQQAVRSFLFYLRSGIDPEGKMSISPFGLSNDKYKGHVFWDADTWVFPALALVDPKEAKAIPNYRLAMRRAAEQNFQRWIGAGRPTSTDDMGRVPMGGELAPTTKYPWESSVSGTETVPGPSRFEEHITGDVAFMLANAAALGLAPAGEVNETIEEAGRYWEWRSIDFMGKRHINGVMSPDESHRGNDDLYTNLLAQWCFNGGNWKRKDISPTIWTLNSPFELPRDQVSFLSYADDPLKGYKQAAAVLSIYPLQYPPAEKEAKTMMDRFAHMITPNGPAMSYSLHALIWARLGQTDTAYDTWLKSWKEFVKEPHLQFSEKGNRPLTYFTTGAAGCLQTVIYGFLGFRIDDKPQPGAVWSTKLVNGKVLSIKPNLPKQWRAVTFKNFQVLGKRYTLLVSHDNVRIITGTSK
jgi:trehalose/maltose hydrolase-like predicted phosphorylase